MNKEKNNIFFILLIILLNILFIIFKNMIKCLIYNFEFKIKKDLI